ncbi:hypothetical protein Psi02_60850 [Planotetraspora silvatica]|uniref:Uncharacterized protein n=1 Tax=Planotetraspora silvatica TaxID=234614 RepID=A0A8J3US87_9ACTN|nr:hypothetical protein Psi02_60850 [Planotetraspora silvatica]
MDIAPRPIRETRRLPSMACCIKNSFLVETVEGRCIRGSGEGRRPRHPGADLDLADTQPTSGSPHPDRHCEKGYSQGPLPGAGRAYP